MDDLIKTLDDLKYKQVGKGIFLSYDLDISYFDNDYKVISVAPSLGNQYIYIRQGDEDKPREEDKLICIFNSDIHGELTSEYITNLTKILKL